MGWLDEYKDEIPKAQAGMTKSLKERKEFDESLPPERPLVKLKDNRKIRATTNAPMRPSSDSIESEYSLNNMDEFMIYAKNEGLSKDDLWNLAAMEMQETGLGNRSDGQVGHVLGDFGGRNDAENFVKAYKKKMAEADRLGITDPEKRLQVYNGMGTVYPDTEEGYHGFKMDKIYGVPLDEKGINLSENPLYGRQIIDIRDNVLKKNKDFVNYIDSTYSAPPPKFHPFSRQNINEDIIPLEASSPFASGELQRKAMEESEFKSGGTIPKAQKGRKEVYSISDPEELRKITDAWRAKNRPEEWAKIMHARSSKQAKEESIKEWVANSMEEVKDHPLWWGPGAVYTSLGAAPLYGSRFLGIANEAINPLAGIGSLAKLGKNKIVNWLDDLADGVEDGFKSFGKEAIQEAPPSEQALWYDLQQKLNQPKPVSLPTKKPEFKSEINWGKWNEEIPGNKKLMDEYLSIEESTKANGTWMKNADGSEFKGTPEQFVQRRSENYLKNFDRDAPITQRADISKWDTFKSQEELGLQAIKERYNLHKPEESHMLEKIWNKKKDKLNTGIYSTPYKDYFVNIYNNPQWVVQDLYASMKHPKITDTSESFTVLAKDRDKLLREGYDSMHTPPSELYPGEYVVFNSGQLKSATGNNGMFDITNPNIYKSIFPLMLGSAVITNGKTEKTKEYQDGGIIKDNRGQWAHPGKVTQIDSNQITMKGVDYPVLGVSDTGDTQLMQPGGEYSFDGNNVTEFPIKAQEGHTSEKENKNIDTLFVNSKLDPRYIAYKDSLDVFETDRILTENLLKRGYSQHNNKPVSKGGHQRMIDKYADKANSRIKINSVEGREGMFTTPDYYADVVDTTLGTQYISRNIIPQSMRSFGKWIIKEGDILPSYDLRKTSNYTNAKPNQIVVYKPIEVPSIQGEKYTDYQPNRTPTAPLGVKRKGVTPLNIKGDDSLVKKPKFAKTPIGYDILKIHQDNEGNFINYTGFTSYNPKVIESWAEGHDKSTGPFRVTPIYEGDDFDEKNSLLNQKRKAQIKKREDKKKPKAVNGWLDDM